MEKIPVHHQILYSSLCATEWYIRNFFVCMTCGASGTQGMSIFSDGIHGISSLNIASK
jgi:hypothetical protein